MDYKIKFNYINDKIIINNMAKDARIFAICNIINNYQQQNKGEDIVIIANNDEEVTKISSQISFYRNLIINSKNAVRQEMTVIELLSWDSQPFDYISPKPIILSKRIKSLYRLATRNDDERFIIITTINNLLQKTLSPLSIKNIGLYLQVGSRISLQQIANFLISKGYERRSCANDSGQFAIRGGMIDFTTIEAGDLVGYRIDFFGEEIESIKIFDPITQISNNNVRQLEILPASEVLLNDDNIANFRTKYRQLFGINNINNQFYDSISNHRSYPGMEHWLALFYQEDLVAIDQYCKKPIYCFDEEILSLAKIRIENIKQSYYARIDEIRINNKQQKNKEYDISLNNDKPLMPMPIDLLFLDYQQLQQLLNSNYFINFRSDKMSQENIDVISDNNYDYLFKNVANSEIDLIDMPNFWQAKEHNRNIANIDNKSLYLDPISLCNDFINQHQFRIIIIATSNEAFLQRMIKILPDYGIYSIVTQEFPLEIYQQNKTSKKIFICNMNIDFGFFGSDVAVIGEKVLYGEKIIHKRSSKIDATRLIEEGLAIKNNDLVVHRHYGIGKFAGIEKITANNISFEMLKIIFDGGDSLFVNVDDMNLITRYGSDNPLIQLDKLGGNNWKNKKNKARKTIKIAAEQLMLTAAKRQLTKASILIADDIIYNELSLDFGFNETDDQIRAIEEVANDLQRGILMDRLICGDVGFGKTEVAIRATAIAISSQLDITLSDEQNIEKNDNNEKLRYQVAIIAPTTLLAMQHYQNFSKRFTKYGYNVAHLSRLVSGKESKRVKEDLAKGKIDIIIGTHSLLQKDIKFANLALAIIDEEQHFGVVQKEQIKQFANNLHLLTLSATPIPRTLQMSLTGVKDLSLITTPPEARLAVRNFVMKFDNIVVKEAIIREYNRSGKIFIVVPKIRDLEELTPQIKELVPDLRIASANGKMPASQLEKIISDFINDKIDVLIATTIIESGLDIPNANTIIIYKAENFGLAQLYQLRGRVGRGKIRGYAYFMTYRHLDKNSEQRKKLEIIENLDSLGVGFNIASHDMDLRGSGNLLGDEQSGHVAEIGAEFYQQMLIEEVEKIKKINITDNNQAKQGNIDDKENEDFSVQIKAAISLFIPEDYIDDLSLRMSFYKKISLISNIQDFTILQQEMEDRFGPIPITTINLFYIAILKKYCHKLGISKIEYVNQSLLVSFYDNNFKNGEDLISMIFNSNNQIRFYQENGKQELLNRSNINISRDFKQNINRSVNNYNNSYKISQKILFTNEFLTKNNGENSRKNNNKQIIYQASEPRIRQIYSVINKIASLININFDNENH